MIRAFFSSWESALRSSGIMEDDKEKGGRKRRRKTGGCPARERRRLKRAQERLTTTSSKRSPSPSDTSALVSDDVRLYMGEGVVLPMGGSRGGPRGHAPPQSANIIKGFGPHIDDCPTARQYVAPPNPKSWIRP